MKSKKWSINLRQVIKSCIITIISGIIEGATKSAITGQIDIKSAVLTGTIAGLGYIGTVLAEDKNGKFFSKTKQN